MLLITQQIQWLAKYSQTSLTRTSLERETSTIRIFIPYKKIYNVQVEEKRKLTRTIYERAICLILSLQLELFQIDLNNSITRSFRNKESITVDIS